MHASVSAARWQWETTAPGVGTSLRERFGALRLPLPLPLHGERGVEGSGERCWRRRGGFAPSLFRRGVARRVSRHRQGIGKRRSGRRGTILAAVTFASLSFCAAAPTPSAAFLPPHRRRRYVGRAASPRRGPSLLWNGDRDVAVRSARIPEEDAAPPGRAAMGAREILATLERAYPECGDGEGWARTRRYLYQYCAAARANDGRNENDDARGGRSSSRRRRRNSRRSLTPSDLDRLLSFLRTTFPENPRLQAQVLQRTPRILGQSHSIESRLIPTVEFLRGLYGGMDRGDQSGEDGMFIEAISRNTNLLLVRGVGYSGSRGGGKTDGNATRNDKEGDDDLAVEEYLRRELGVPTSVITRLKRTHPTLFQLSLGGTVRPVVRFLYSLLGNGDSAIEPPSGKGKKQVAKMVTHHPMLLQLDVASNLAPTARFLRNSCDFSEKELSAVVATAPGALGLSVEGNLRPTLQFLGEVLELGGTKRQSDDGERENSGKVETSRALLHKCVLRHPQVLALSLRNLMEKRDYFDNIDRNDSAVRDGEEKENKSKPSLAGRILASAPSTYSLSLKGNIIPKVECLASLWGVRPSTSGSAGEGGPSLSDNLREYPQILTLSLEGNIVPTLSFYNVTGYIDLDLHGLPRRPPTHILKSRYIASSLYNRLLPRWHYFREEHERRRRLGEDLASLMDDGSAKSTVRKKTPSAASDQPPLHLLAGASDETFCRQMKLSLGDYLAFKEEAAPRLKFSAQFDRWLKTGRPIDLVSRP